MPPLVAMMQLCLKLFHVSLDLMNCVLYVIHSASGSTLKLQRDWNKKCKMKRIKPRFPSNGFCGVCVELHLGLVTRRAGAWAGITALQFEIGFTEVLPLLLPVLATMLKRMYSICATSWVDLSLLASVSFGERLRWREHNTLPCLLLYYMVCTIVEVFGKLLPSNNACDQAKFIHKECLSKFLELLSRTHEEKTVPERTLRGQRCCLLLFSDPHCNFVVLLVDLNI